VTLETFIGWFFLVALAAWIVFVTAVIGITSYDDDDEENS